MEVFNKLLQAFIDINTILLANQVVNTEFYTFIDSRISTPYFNFAIPKIGNINVFPLLEVESKFKNVNKPPTIYLLENQQNGFIPTLTQNGYVKCSADTWVMYSGALAEAKQPNNTIHPISFDDFENFESILLPVFADFAGNADYQRVIKDSLKGTHDFINHDLTSEAFIIFKDDVPASGGALLYSKRGNYAYLHNAGTLPEYRKKGYQSDLIRYRTKRALNLGIQNIFSLVELGGQSHKNMLANGYKTLHTAEIYTKSTE
jgi:GNAT superfamily N-acetyltransferase